MPAPATTDEFVDLVRKSGVQDEKKLDSFLEKVRAAPSQPTEPGKLAGLMVRDGLLTHFQAEQLLLGKWRRFNIGKYKVLERLGSGGMGSVYLCEHKLMRRRVAVKVLPTAKADDPSSLERFYREARAVAALDHPNIVRAYDIDQDDNLHFLVMEYVDGADLQEILRKAGNMNVLRACHYMRQAAQGLQHAHEAAGLVHRDIKPGNILVDRNGVVKILDMGLARFFHDEEDILTKKYDENVLGTADYLAPEQALDSHAVDIRADIYGLGATFYYCLTGRAPFNEGTVAQKLIWHQTRQPKPIRNLRPDVPEGLVAIIDKMMAKEPGQRYQLPSGVMEALVPWTQTPIPPPPEAEMPQLCLAAMGSPTTLGDGALNATAAPGPSGMPSPAPRKAWQVSGAPGIKPADAAIRPAPGPKGAAPPPVNRSPASPVAVTPPVRTKPAAAVQPPRLAGNGRMSAAQEALRPAQLSLPDQASVAWDQLTPDTAERAARADTDPGMPRKEPTSSHLRLNQNAAHAERNRRRMLLVVAVVAGLSVLVLGIALVVGLILKGPTREANDPAPPPPATLYVRSSGGDGVLRTIAAALDQAKNGDRIVVMEGPIVEAPLVIDGKSRKRLRDVTLESDPNTTVVWQLPSGAKPANQLLLLMRLEGFRIRGFTFDGGARVRDLLVLSDQCPGLSIENVTLKGFQRSGVLFHTCAGSAEKPVFLSEVQVLGSPKEKAQYGFYFDINPNVQGMTVNQHIDISPSCQLQGIKEGSYLINQKVVDNTVRRP